MEHLAVFSLPSLTSVMGACLKLLRGMGAQLVGLSGFTSHHCSLHLGVELPIVEAPGCLRYPTST